MSASDSDFDFLWKIIILYLGADFIKNHRVTVLLLVKVVPLIIESFIAYYYIEAQSLIANARPHSYLFPDDKQECDELINPSNFNASEMEEFKRYLNSEIICPRYQELRLTKREIDCIYRSSLGESAKIAASNLNIAKKTVERHLDNARKKLGAKNKVALLKTINEINPNLLLQRGCI